MAKKHIDYGIQLSCCIIMVKINRVTHIIHELRSTLHNRTSEIRKQPIR